MKSLRILSPIGTLLLSLFLIPFGTTAQLSGFRTVSSSSTNYPSIKAAVDSLNKQGVGKGGIIFNIASGQTFNESPMIITATGTAANPIVFQKAGGGAKPVIKVTGTSGNDAAIKLVGTDYITFDSLEIADAGSSSSDYTEYGFWLVRASGADGCQHVSIQNCTIHLNGLYTLSTGIYQKNIDNSGNPTEPSSASGKFLDINISGNIIYSVWGGIRINGSTTSGYYDENMSIGVKGGNHITFGDSGATSSTYGILTAALKNARIANNVLKTAPFNGSSNTFGIRSTSTLVGSLNIYNNKISVSSNVASYGNVYGLLAAQVGNYSDSMNIYNNIIENCYIDSSGNGSACDFRGIQLGTSVGHLDVHHNKVRNNYQNSPSGTNPPLPCSGINYSGGVNFMAIYAGSNDSNFAINLHDNEIYGNRFVADYIGIASDAPVSNIYANNIHNDTLVSSSGTKWFIGIYNPSLTQNIYKNHIHNLYSTSNATAYMYGVLENTYQRTYSNIYENEIDSLSLEGGKLSGIEHNQSGCLGSSSDTVTFNIFGNNIYSLFNNQGLQPVYGIYTHLYPGGILLANVYNNMISDLRSVSADFANAIAGIYADEHTTLRAFNNTINLYQDSVGTDFSSSAIFLSATADSLDMRNNILVNTSIPGSSSSGLTMAFGTDASSPYDAYSDYSNNNLFYAGSSGSKNVIFSDGSSNYQTLSDFKSAIGKKRDSLSIWSKPDFISPINLHLSASNNCSIKGHGAVITNPFAIKYDIDSNVRSTTNPDLGADEFKASKSGVWMGLNNKNWTNGVNWCDGIAPTDSVDVYISANAPYQPEHSSGTAQCRNLVIDSFASLTVSGGTFTLNGNLDDRSFFSTGKGSEFILGGNKTQNVSSPSALSFDKLTTSGNSIKSFTKNIYVSSELNLGAGNLKLNGDTLFLNGKLINDAMYSGNGAIVLTRGSASHDLSGKGNFANLILNDSIGASLSGSINETGTISLKRGSIYLGSMDLTLAPTGFIFPYDSKNYIVTDNTGSLIKQGLDTNTFEFPIGTSKAYAKVTLKANANNGDTAGARVIEPLQDSIFNPALPVGTESYVKKQWFIKARALSSKANIGLYWNTSDEVKSPFSDVGYYTGSGWIKTNGVVNNQSASIGNYPLISRTFAVYSPAKITSIDGNLQSSNEIKAWIPQDKNMLNLEFTNNIKQRMQIRLLSSSGQMMYSTTLNTSGKMLAIDIPALAEGVYFISLQTDSYSVVKKVYKF